MSIGYDTYKDFLEKLLGSLKSNFGEGVIIACALFGSVARGEAKIHSDIDLLVVHEQVKFDPAKRFVDTLLETRKEKEYLQLIEKGIYPEPSIIFVTPEEISHRPLILLDIMDHGLILLDENGFLAGKLKKLKEKLTEMGAEKIILKDGSWAWDLKPDWRPGEVIEIVL
ncbi:MAG TPA: nucleotidyltransferase domain-containing protein [Thermodesulfobacteriota bacterium]|nr:nucleotidyltransferase domain-containing protein [Thermodesulfobacteriota bacterium]